MTTLTATATAVKRQILASKIDVARSLNNESALKWELARFFQDLRDKVLKEMDEYYPNDETGVLLQGQLDLILAPIFESQRRYYNILRRFNSKEYTFGVNEAKRLVKLSKSQINSASKSKSDTFKPESLINIEKDDLFGTLDWSRDQLQNQTFTASEHTINRVDKDINQILTDGYTIGKGIHAVRDDITRRFDQLSDWEANRIARTEIHNAHQMGIINTYQNLGVEYIQWSSAHDWRVRGMKKKDKANHVILDGEIIPLGGTFSNDLMHPGDRTGKIEEWINCRCSAIPFIIPDGYIAPSFSPFKEKDLIPTLDLFNQDNLIEVKEDSGKLYNMKLSRDDVINFPKRVRNTIKEQFITTPEKTAKYFGLKYDYWDLNSHKFIDKTNGCTIYVEKIMGHGENPLISMQNNGKAEINLIELLRTYSEAPPEMKKAIDEIYFVNKGAEIDSDPGGWDIIDGKSVAVINTICALNEFSNYQCPIQRTILHEMSHGVHLNPKRNIGINEDKIKKLIEKKGHSSYYATTKKHDLIIPEEIADAISMVAYKNKSDKSTAIIRVPVYNKNGGIERYDILNYWEWHDKFEDLATYLENKLSL